MLAAIFHSEPLPNRPAKTIRENHTIRTQRSIRHTYRAIEPLIEFAAQTTLEPKRDAKMMRKIKAILKRQDKTGPPTSAILSSRSHLHAWRQQSNHNIHYHHHRYQTQPRLAPTLANMAGGAQVRYSSCNGRFVSTTMAQAEASIGRTTAHRLSRRVVTASGLDTDTCNDWDQVVSDRKRMVEMHAF